MDSKLEEVVRMSIQALNKSGAAYAIGGAIALRSHGIVRETRDLDVFLKDEQVHPIFTAFRNAGFEIVRWGGLHHFAAILPKYKRYLPDYRVDLMVTMIPSEVNAIEYPMKLKVAGKTVPVFPPTELAASKFLAGDPKNLQDVVNIIQHGLTSPFKVHELLLTVTEDDAAEFLVFARKTGEEYRANQLKKRKRRT